MKLTGKKDRQRRRRYRHGELLGMLLMVGMLLIFFTDPIAVHGAEVTSETAEQPDRKQDELSFSQYSMEEGTVRFSVLNPGEDMLEIYLGYTGGKSRLSLSPDFKFEKWNGSQYIEENISCQKPKHPGRVRYFTSPARQLSCQKPGEGFYRLTLYLTDDGSGKVYPCTAKFRILPAQWEQMLLPYKAFLRDFEEGRIPAYLKTEWNTQQEVISECEYYSYYGHQGSIWKQERKEGEPWPFQNQKEDSELYLDASDWPLFIDDLTVSNVSECENGIAVDQSRGGELWKRICFCKSDDGHIQYVRCQYPDAKGELQDACTYTVLDSSEDAVAAEMGDKIPLNEEKLNMQKLPAEIGSEVPFPQAYQSVLDRLIQEQGEICGAFGPQCRGFLCDLNGDSGEELFLIYSLQDEAYHWYMAGALYTLQAGKPVEIFKDQFLASSIAGQGEIMILKKDGNIYPAIRSYGRETGHAPVLKEWGHYGILQFTGAQLQTVTSGEFERYVTGDRAVKVIADYEGSMATVNGHTASYKQYEELWEEYEVIFEQSIFLKTDWQLTYTPMKWEELYKNVLKIHTDW